jgi:hypothetical protein
VSEADTVVRLSIETARFTAALAAFSRTIGYEVLPAMQKLNAALEAWHRTWPGMLYTGPSPWNPEQMIGARGPRR